MTTPIATMTTPIAPTVAAAPATVPATSVPRVQSATRADNDLEPSGINPAWVRAGRPEARISQWGSSADGMTSTYVWSCTAGTFDWTFDRDEVVHIVDGSVTVTSPEGETRTLAVGDSCLFPAGTTWLWHVPTYVRKHAVLVTPVPAPLLPGVRVLQLSRRAALRVGLDARRARLAAQCAVLTGVAGMAAAELTPLASSLSF